MKALLGIALFLAAGTLAMADAITSKDALYYTSEPTKWDGKKATIMVTGCSTTTKLSEDKKTTIFYVYTMNGYIYVHVPTERAKAFVRRYTNTSYAYQRRILVGTFHGGEPPYIEADQPEK
jgi:hypothetical protein